MPKPEIAIQTLQQLLQNEALHIPEYQRPYSWTEKQLMPLLQDLSAQRDVPLIMGGIILHKEENGKLNIVDGQQRLVSFSIIQYLLNRAESIRLLSAEFTHADSVRNIRANLRTINNYIQKRRKNLNLDNIHFVVLTTTQLDEAFAFFDTQNTRGKALHSYDILKAHHLRYIQDDNLATDCVVNWERIEKDESTGLSLLLQTLLARGRVWSHNHHYYPDIREEFKSQRVPLNKQKKAEGENIQLGPVNYQLNRYQQSSLFRVWRYNPGKDLQFIFEQNDTQHDSERLIVNNNPLRYLPIQIGQSIEGGELFFWYTQKYHDLLSNLFDKGNPETSAAFKELLEQLAHYNYSTGTKYVYEIYRGALLFYIDKFGYHQLDDIAADLFFAIYWLRIRQQGVQYASVYKYIREVFNPFTIIMQAGFPQYISNRCRDFVEDKDFYEKASGKIIPHIQEKLLRGQLAILINHPSLRK